MINIMSAQPRTRNRYVFSGLVIFIIGVLLLASCSLFSGEGDQMADESGQPQNPPGGSPALVNATWMLVAFGDVNNPTVVEDGTLITVFFSPDGTVAGSGGCNQYNSTYQVNGDQLTIASPIASTMAACEKGGEQETIYLTALQQTQSYQITEQGNLNINYDSGSGIEEALVYIPEKAPLEGTQWTLVSMGPVDSPQPPVPGANFTAIFTRDPAFPTGVLSGNTGCNDYRSTYFATENEMKINLPGATANPDCPAGLPEQEQAYYQALFAVRSYNIVSQNMQVFYGDQVLNFTAGAPPAPAPTEPPAAGDLSQLNGTRWWLKTVETAPIIPGTEITAEFFINPDGVTGTISGFSGCNTYTGEITGMFAVANIVSTETACDQTVMDQETTYLSALGTSAGLTWDPSQMLINTQFGVLGYGSTPEAAPPVETAPPEVELPTATITPEGGTPAVTETPGAEQPIQTEAPAAPVVIIAITPDPSTSGGETTFDGSTSYGSADIVGYSWDFGDGAVAEGATVTHSFAAPGTYNVSLTVTDGLGQVATGQYPLVVN